MFLPLSSNFGSLSSSLVFSLMHLHLIILFLCISLWALSLFLPTFLHKIEAKDCMKRLYSLLLVALLRFIFPSVLGRKNAASRLWLFRLNANVCVFICFSCLLLVLQFCLLSSQHVFPRPRSSSSSRGPVPPYLREGLYFYYYYIKHYIFFVMKNCFLCCYFEMLVNLSVWKNNLMLGSRFGVCASAWSLDAWIRKSLYYSCCYPALHALVSFAEWPCSYCILG